MSEALPLVLQLLHGRTDATEEAEVLQLVRGMPAAELNELLARHGDELFSSVDDRLLGPDHRSELVDVLADERWDDLDLHARAAVVQSMQLGRTGEREERLIARLLCSVHGEELTHLKNILSLRKDHHDLEGLVFIDIDHEDVRRQVLDHIAEQAAGLQFREAKVLSDIDDTVFCKLHDKRYPKGTLYPGVLAFQEALDRGPSDNPVSTGDLTFVTARPMDVFGLVENHSRETLTRAGVADLSVLSGSVFSLLSLDAMAGKKVENVDYFHQLFPEYRMTFMGDSGQGDVKVGEKLWESYGDAMDAVFIHDVVDTPPEERAARAEQRIWFHDTYVGAANKALELGLISAAGRQHVLDEARRQVDEIAWESDQQRAAIEALLDRDAAAGPALD